MWKQHQPEKLIMKICPIVAPRKLAAGQCDFWPEPG
jgi:hypothetical protein